MEKINGEYQGAAWAFRSGFQSGIVRLAWAKDGSLIAGETNRGWGSAGEASEGLQRLVWNNNIPFEMRAVRAMPDGFEIEFTKPVAKETAEDLASYSVESSIYKYHAVYGSPLVNKKQCVLKGVKVSADGLKARLIVNNLQRYYIHTISLFGIREKATSFSLVHPTAYYTLNTIPAGDKLAMKGVSTKNSAARVNNTNVAGSKPGTTNTATAGGMVDEKMIRNILKVNTCLACHHPTKRQVGPSYAAIAKRNYSAAQIMSLIRSPKPEHWPDYSTPMPPMPQVSAADARIIASYIMGLQKK
jgi:cytochrome c551/c552